MRKLLFLTLALMLAACGTEPKAIITGSLTNAANQTVYLMENVGGDFVTIDSTEMADGAFTLSTTNTYPRPAVITFSKEFNKRRNVIIEEGTMTLVGDFDVFHTAKASGTLVADKNEELIALMTPVQREIDALTKQFQALMSNKNLPDSEKEKEGSVMQARYLELQGKNQEVIKQFTEDNKDNLFGTILICEERADDFDSVMALLERISPEASDNQFVDDLRAKAATLKSIRIGAIAPDFTLPQADGTELTLSSLRGQVVLVDFWASWCGPCRAANPNVVELYKEFNSKGFTVLGVSYDENKANWLKAIEADSLTWNHVSSLKGWNCPTVDQYCVQGIPCTFLLDRTGAIVGRNLHGSELRAAVEKLVK